MGHQFTPVSPPGYEAVCRPVLDTLCVSLSVKIDPVFRAEFPRHCLCGIIKPISSSTDYLWRGLISEPPSLPPCTCALPQRQLWKWAPLLLACPLPQGGRRKSPSSVTREEGCGCRFPRAGVRLSAVLPQEPRVGEKARRPALCGAGLGGAAQTLEPVPARTGRSTAAGKGPTRWSRVALLGTWAPRCQEITPSPVYCSVPEQALGPN